MKNNQPKVWTLYDINEIAEEVINNKRHQYGDPVGNVFYLLASRITYTGRIK
jgi:hypothetical protein